MKIASKVIYTVRTIIQADHVEEFNEWQDTEHVPWIFSVPGYYSNQRFKCVEEEYKYMNMWEIESIAAHDSPEKMAHSGSPWGKRMLRFRKLFVTFYQQVMIWDRPEDKENIFSSMVYLVWDPKDITNDKETAFAEEELLNMFKGKKQVLGVRIFEAIRGEGKHLFMIYLKETDDEINALIDEAYKALKTRTDSVTKETYLPMAPAIYKS